MSGQKEKFTISYSNGALKALNDMTEQYGFENKEETLNFALVVLQRLGEEGTVSLKNKRM